jgi:hypothetical protein
VRFDLWFRSTARQEYPLSEALLPPARGPAPAPPAAPSAVPQWTADEAVDDRLALLRPLWLSLDATQRETLAPMALALLRKRVAPRQGGT